MLSILKKHTILYVEADPIVQADIAKFLGDYFRDVYLASNDQQALDQYKKHRPDALILDIKLPNIDGLSVAEEVRMHDSAIKIILLTAYYEKEKLLKAVELKLTKYLIKPTPLEKIKETLEKLAYELKDNSSRFLKINDSLIWDIEKQQLTCNGQQINLSDKECRLLNLFIRQKGKTVRYEKIVSTIWENTLDRDISINSIKNRISQLRKKSPNIRISSVYGEGYILR